MAEIDNTVALGVKPPAPQQDIIGPITSLAQLQYLQAHGALESAQAQFQQGKIGALHQYGNLIKGGAAPEDAITSSSLGAYDPAGANAMLGNIGTARSLKSNQAYATTGDPKSLAIQGPEAVSKGVTAGVDSQAYGQGLQIAKTQNEVAIQRLGMAGQVANGVLAMGDVNGNPPPGGIPAGVRQDAVSKALSMGLINQEQAAQEAKMSDGDFWNVAKSWAGMAQGAKDFAETSGQARGRQTAAESGNKPEQLSPGNSLVVPNSGLLPASGVGQPPTASGAAAGPNYFGAVAKHESGGNPSATNPNGGAAGLYQFMPGTWRGLMQSHPELGLTANGATDPAQATKAMQAFTSDNAKILSQGGVPVNDKSLFMAHFLGAGGAVKFLQAAGQNPNANAADIFPAEAKQNPTIFYSGGSPRSLGQVYGLMTKNFGNGLSATGATSGAGAGFGGQSVALPAAAGGSLSPPTLGAPAAIPPATVAALAPAAQNPVETPAPAQGTVAPIVKAPEAPSAPAAAPAPGSAPTGQSAFGAPGSVNNGGVTVLAPGMSLAEKAAQEKTGAGMAEAQVAQYTKAKGDYDAANTAQMKLGELQGSLSDMPASGLLASGTGAAERLGWAKTINTALAMAGAKPYFNPSDIASAESSQKITGNLGFDLSRTLGTKEAASITEQAIKLNPGIENSPQGARVVVGAINAGLQRQKDFYQFLSENRNAPDADLKFNKEHPPAQYVKEARALATIPSPAIRILQSRPELAPMFDKNYGAGLSRYFTGQ